VLPLCSVQALPRPQQSGTQAILLAPPNFVCGAGQAVISTGGAIVNSVPSTVDFIGGERRPAGAANRRPPSLPEHHIKGQSHSVAEPEQEPKP
jgi:hypothetical protein